MLSENVGGLQLCAPADCTPRCRKCIALGRAGSVGPLAARSNVEEQAGSAHSFVAGLRTELESADGQDDVFRSTLIK